jgi:putative alpha-1,2-mannosidase
MKRLKFLLFICYPFIYIGCSDKSNEDLKVNWVDPFIATEGDHGQLYPGATTPFGLVKLSPETTGTGHSGYQYQEKYIYGFSHVRTDGPGCEGAGGNILLQPGIGFFVHEKDKYKQEYIKDSEIAVPGFYGVKYRSGIYSELTVTPRVGFHRYTFPNADSCFILLDLSHSHGGMIDAELNVVSNEKITGVISSYNPCGARPYYIHLNQHYKLYFSMIFNKPFEKSITWDSESSDEQVLFRKGKDIGVWLDFKNLKGNEVQVKVGVSPVSISQAEREINTECPGWDFETIKNEASKSWENKLRKIDIKTDRDDLKKLFYTLLYRSYTSPTVANASSGAYRPALKEDTLKQTIDLGAKFTYYCGWDIWGNYRNKFGLIAITEPEVMRNVAISILEYYRHRPNIVGTGYSFLAEGYWPAPSCRQEFAGIYILEAIEKGLIELTSDDLNIAFEGFKQDYKEYPEHTFAFCLEKSYHAWIVMRMAQIIGNQEEVEKYKYLALNYQKHWNPRQKDHEGKERGFFTFNGQNVEKENVLAFGKHAYEGNLWHYRWNIPFDVQGLINLRGSKDLLVDDLEYFFEQNLFMITNQPDIQLPYLFNFLGKPWLTQKWVRKYTTKEAVHLFHNHGFYEEPVIRRSFLPQPKGFLPTMDDDIGQNSSWFVQSAIGLFPAIPGEQLYFIGSPIFPEINISLENGNNFVIKANNVSEDNFYIKSAMLNGSPLNKAWLNHSDIVNGGILEFEMDSVPNYNWGTSEVPHSLSDQI